jgi:DNA-binding NarL/FixJ family response regulator
MKAIRVVLVDDHTLVRSALRAVLEQRPHIHVAAEAATGPEALSAARTHRPDVVLLDLSLPGMGGLEVTRHLTEELPDTKVLVLSMHANDEYVLQALRAGAAGYLLKNSSYTELDLALRNVAAGGIYLSAAIPKSVMADYLGPIGKGKSQLERLSPRQRQVLRMIAEGRGTKAIAQELDLSVKTVETHRAHLMRRLRISDVPGLVRFAIRTGQVQLE